MEAHRATVLDIERYDDVLCALDAHQIARASAFIPLVSLVSLRCCDTDLETLSFPLLIPGLTRLNLATDCWTLVRFADSLACAHCGSVSVTRQCCC